MSQSRRCSNRIHSRASEPLRKHTRLMKSPVGDRKTCDGRGPGCGVHANTVSLVPSETARMPGRITPVPTRLLGLSPDQLTIAAGGNE